MKMRKAGQQYIWIQYNGLRQLQRIEENQERRRDSWLIKENGRKLKIGG